MRKCHGNGEGEKLGLEGFLRNMRNTRLWLMTIFFFIAVLTCKDEK